MTCVKALAQQRGPLGTMSGVQHTLTISKGFTTSADIIDEPPAAMHLSFRLREGCWHVDIALHSALRSVALKPEMSD